MLPNFVLSPGETPVLVSIPHAGTMLPDGMEARLTELGRLRVDTDWYLDRLHQGARERGHGLMTAGWSRTLIDLNRGADDVSLYPGRAGTGLAPLTAFDGQPLYLPGAEPDAAEIAARVAACWQPYHDAIAAELDRLRAKWGWAVLWDGHSIRTEVPRLFEGRLPDLNFGTDDGRSCDPDFAATVLAAARAAARAAPYSQVRDGRFKGGFTTRHHGQPDRQVHTIQLEMAQSTYLASEDAPFPIEPVRFERLRDVVLGLVDVAAAWRPRVL